MDIIQVRRIISLVANAVFPKAPLPNASLPAHPPAAAKSFPGLNTFGERHLNRLPSAGVIRVAFGKCPERVHMVRQHHPSINVEWHEMPDPANRRAKQPNMCNQQLRPPIKQVDRKEIAATRHADASVFGHSALASTTTAA